MNIGGSREITFKSVIVDGHEYQLPTEVVRALETLNKELEKEQKAHEQTKAEIKDLRTDDFEKYTKRIMYNLSQGTVPMKKTNLSLNVDRKFKKDDSVLAHELDHATLEYRDEVYTRIFQALKGNKLDDGVYRKFGK